MNKQRASCWSVTINNPTPQDEEYISLARQRGWKVDGQLEKGEQGTSHYQLILRTPQCRFSQVKKAFPRGHIEVAKNPAALELYVHKTDTRVAALPQSQECFPSVLKVWDLIFDDLRVGWNCDECSVDFKKNPLDIFDQSMSRLIRRGYNVESIAVNPQIRSCFSKFAEDIMYRIYIRRQTDRQTAQEVIVPTIHSQDVSPEGSEEGSSDGSSYGSSDGSSCGSPF